MICQIIGCPPISIMGLGRWRVSSLNLVPNPPANITAFILPLSSIWCGSRFAVCMNVSVKGGVQTTFVPFRSQTHSRWSEQIRSRASFRKRYHKLFSVAHVRLLLLFINLFPNFYQIHVNKFCYCHKSKIVQIAQYLRQRRMLFWFWPNSTSIEASDLKSILFNIFWCFGRVGNHQVWIYEQVDYIVNYQSFTVDLNIMTDYWK